jgi:DNA (cytosine-5)-methyltransferase 1
MKHYGDITKINGAEAEPVNVIIGGSPCQDLSVSGKQAGLSGKRSGLFMEQIRIIKEMRESDARDGRTGNSIRPRFMVWENVPGAFSSNKGADFGTVLDETVGIACEKAPAVPTPKKGWPRAGCLVDVGGKWSVAWRVFDAQFWGVPQRRKRIALVADFGGLAAPEILFERAGVFGDFEQGGEKEYHATDPAGSRADETVGAICIQGNAIDRADTAGCNGKGFAEEISYTLNTVDRPVVAVFCPGQVSRIGERFYWENSPSPTLRAEYADNRPAILLESHPEDSRIKILENGAMQTLSARMGTGGGNTPLVMTTPIAATCEKERKDLTVVHLTQDPIMDDAVAPCLSTGSPGGQATAAIEMDYTVRRITPLECERLMGFQTAGRTLARGLKRAGNCTKKAPMPRGIRRWETASPCRRGNTSCKSLACVAATIPRWQACLTASADSR